MLIHNHIVGDVFFILRSLEEDGDESLILA